MSGRWYYVVFAVAIAVALALSLDLPRTAAIVVERSRLDDLTPDELVARCEAEAWWVGERIAELGADAVPAIRAALASDDEERRARAWIALVWSGESGARAWLDAWDPSEEPGWTTYRVPRVLDHLRDARLARPDTTPEEYGRNAWRLARGILERFPAGDPGAAWERCASPLWTLAETVAEAGAEPTGWRILLDRDTIGDAWFHRTIAAEVLGRLEPVLHDELVRAARDGGEPFARLIAAEALLGPTPSAVVVDAIDTCLRVGDRDLRYHALYVADRIREPDGSCLPLVETLRMQLPAEGRLLAAATARVLGVLAPVSKPAIPDLRAVLADEGASRESRRNAAAALWRLGEDPAALARAMAPLGARKLVKHLETNDQPPDLETYLAVLDGP